MTLTKSIAISTSIHFILCACLLIPHARSELDFNIKHGVSSLSINIMDSPKSKNQKERQIRRKALNEVDVMVSTSKSWEISHNDIKIVKNKRKQNKSEKFNSKNVIGAIYKKATQLSQNEPPEYPYFARRMGYQGRVTLDIQILPTGKAGSINLIKSSGFDILDNSAIRAAERWKYFEEDQIQLHDPIIITKSIEFIIRNERKMGN